MGRVLVQLLVGSIRFVPVRKDAISDGACPDRADAVFGGRKFRTDITASVCAV
jgi:hypothetical protein